MNKKTLTISIILILAVIVLGVVFGLGKREAQVPVVDNVNIETPKNGEEMTETATTTEEATEEIETPEIDTSNWKTYRSEEFGIEFKYPEDWELRVSANKRVYVALRSPKYTPITSGEVILSDDIYIKKIHNPNNLSILDLIDTFSDTSRLWPSQFKYEEVYINNREVLIFPVVDDGYSRKEVYIKSAGAVFSLTYLFEIKDVYVEKIFDLMVENINFTL